MKRIIIYMAACFLIILTFTKCSDEECYSCDPEVDAWVKLNETKLKKMDRHELSKLEISYQKAALRMFSPERKKALWTEKFKAVKELTYTKSANDHLKFAENFLENYNFKDPVSSETEKKLLNWAIEGKEKLNWTDEYIAKSFFFIGDFNQDKVGEEDGPVETGPGGGATGTPNCDCRYHLGCGAPNFWCRGDVDCDETDDGCGFWGTSSCTGSCD